MKHCTRGMDGLRTGLSPSARPFPIASSSFSITASKSEIEDSIWGDYTLDLSFLSSDDQRSALGADYSLSNLSRAVEKTKEEDVVLLNPNPLSSKLPEPLIESSKDAGDEKLGLSCANTSVTSEKSSTETDSEEDSPCWIGILSRKNLASGAKSMNSRRSIDDLSGFHRLNPLAPQFIPSNSKKSLETDGEKREENSSWSLKKSLSSNFPSSSSGEFNMTDSPKDEAARVLTPNADGNIVSKTVSISESRNDFQPSKKLDPLAPVFVPSTVKLSPSVHEKQGDKPIEKVKVATCSGEVGRSVKIRYPDRVHESGSTSSYKPEVKITENAKPGSSSNNSHGQRKLNPLAPQFSLADTKLKAYGYEKYQAADDSSLVVEPDSTYGSTKWFAVEPKATLSVKGDKDFKHPLPFHVVETGAGSSSSSYDAKALFGSSPKMDVKKLLTTMHGLSELLTLARGSDSSNADEDEVDLINSTVQNLNMYMKNSIQEQGWNRTVALQNSYDIQLLPNKSNKLSIRDLQLPRANNMTVDLDVKRKEKYSVFSGETTLPDSRFYQYGVTNDNGFGQVVAQSDYQQNHHYEDQINQQALFYKSLWLKAEADRCLMVYETSLS